jgi:hypothetical protein
MEDCREGSLGARQAMEPRREESLGEIWVFSSAAQRDGRTGSWLPLWAMTCVFAILALSLTTAILVESK